MDELDLGQTIRGFAAGQNLFGRYSLVRILGRGGMGVVWLAHDEKLEREIALKFLPELMVFDEQAVVNLKRETKKSQELRHHHIVSVYDFVSDEHTACIAMEYVDGPTLSALKARKDNNCLEVAEIAPWIEQVCDALSYAHEKAKVVHRDLKPANLMLNSKGELKIADFGIARSLSDTVSMLTKSHEVSGTLLYMSPQQLNGEFPSSSDDIYSLGATIYDLLTSKPPFFTGGIERQICEKLPPPMKVRRSELSITSSAQIPLNWEDCIADCLAKDPTRRPVSAAILAERLRGKQLGTAAVSTAPPLPPSLPPVLASQTQRMARPWPLIIGGAVAVVGFIAIVAVYFFLWSPTNYAPRTTAIETPAATQQTSTTASADRVFSAEELRDIYKGFVLEVRTTWKERKSKFGGEQSRHKGTGVLLFNDSDYGLVATTWSVMEPPEAMTSDYNCGVRFTHDKDFADCLVAARAKKDVDLALLVVKLEGKWTPHQFPIRPLDQIKEGEGCVAIGNAVGEGLSVTPGVIVRFDTVKGQTLIRTSEAVTAGYNGGPLILCRGGALVGIPTAQSRDTNGRNATFATPAQYLLDKEIWEFQKNDQKDEETARRLLENAIAGANTK
jgi:predicted Ser/Thr protein kinase